MRLEQYELQWRLPDGTLNALVVIGSLELAKQAAAKYGSGRVEVYGSPWLHLRAVVNA